MRILNRSTSGRRLSDMHPTLVTRSPEILGGTPVFAGTRVPIQTLVDYLKAGDSIDEFLDGFPSVSRQQVFHFLDAAREHLVQSIT